MGTVIRLDESERYLDRVETVIARRSYLGAELEPLQQELFRLMDEFDSGNAKRRRRLWRLLKVHQRETELRRESDRLDRVIRDALYGKYRRAD